MNDPFIKPLFPVRFALGRAKDSDDVILRTNSAVFQE